MEEQEEEETAEAIRDEMGSTKGRREKMRRNLCDGKCEQPFSIFM